MNKFSFMVLLFFLSLTHYTDARDAVSGNRYQLLSGVRKLKGKKDFWDKKFSDRNYVYGKSPVPFLAKNYEFLPAGSKVLDMGMGEGRNAVFLSRKGYNVTGIDISSVAIKKARRLAREYGVRMKSIIASLEKYNIEDASFDAIICFYYVDRSLNAKIRRWLRPGGILIYQSHTDLQKTVRGNENYENKYLLRPGELVTMFPKMILLKYEEALHRGEFNASLIVQKKFPLPKK